MHHDRSGVTSGSSRYQAGSFRPLRMDFSIEKLSRL